MNIPRIDNDFFDPLKLTTASADRLAGVLLISIQISRAGDTDFRLYAKSASEIMARLKPSDSDLETSLVAHEQRMIADSGSVAGVCFLEVPVGSVNQSLRPDATKITDAYSLVDSGYVASRELADIAHHYFVLYDVQEKFKAPGRVTLAALDLPETEVTEHLKSFYSRLLQAANCMEDWSFAAHSLRAFIPEQFFRFCVDELVSLSLQPVSKDREEIANLLCQIPQLIMQQNYELAAVRRAAYFSAKLGYERAKLSASIISL